MLHLLAGVIPLRLMMLTLRLAVPQLQMETMTFHSVLRQLTMQKIPTHAEPLLFSVRIVGV